ncbi:MAG: hypothetical protein P1U42_01175 [Phycisphaerales bacterium]|nr:hypothetical protein [Phycisphaerales bacterium]
MISYPKLIRSLFTNRCHHRRGFAIAMVVMLMVVVGLGIGVALTRFSAQTKSVSRQVQSYQDHHLGRGLQEAIGAWLRQQNGRELSEVLEPETGHAMDIILSDGSEVSAFLLDAQGAALSNLSGKTDQQIENGGAILRNLTLNSTQAEYLDFTRPFGPMNISVNSAPQRVLDAACRVVAGQYSDQYLTELEVLRNSGVAITRTELTRAASNAGLSSEQRAVGLQIFATDIELWAVIIEVRAGRGSSQGRLISRYGGITRIRVNSRNQGSGNPMELGAFITWNDIGILDREVNLAELY